MIYHKTTFIRHALPFLKMIRDNEYCTDIEIRKTLEEDRSVEVKFTFKPLKIGSVDIVLHIDDSDPDLPMVLTCYRFKEKNSSELIDDYFHEYSNPKYITYQDFKNLIEDIHDWTIDLIIKRQEPKQVFNLLKKYIFMDEDELYNYAKSRSGIKKFNL